jgi:hypothetical protein
MNETRAKLGKLKAIKLVPFEARGVPLVELLASIPRAAQLADERAANVNTNRETTTLDSYLQLVEDVNGQLLLAPINPAPRLEEIWVRPTFTMQGRAATLHKILTNKAAIIEAPAGTGKSTLARVLATALARDRRGIACPEGGSWQKLYFGIDAGERTQVPVLVDLSDVDPRRDSEGIFDAAKPPVDARTRSELEPLLNTGAVVFILNGLDEVSERSRRERLVHIVAQARQRWPQCYFIVTSRPGERGYLGRDFEPAAIAQLSPEGTQTLLVRWASILCKDPSDADAFVERLRKAIDRSSQLQEMATIPLFATLLIWNCVVWRQLPRNKVSLYQSVAKWLLESRSDQRVASGEDMSSSESLLEATAWMLVQRGRASMELSAILRELATMLPASRSVVERALRVEIQLGNFLESQTGAITFWHTNLRDYFAACWLFKCQVRAVGIAPEVQRTLFIQEYQECLDVVIGLLAINEPKRCQTFLDDVDSLGGAGAREAVKKSALRRRILDVAEAHGYRPPAEYRRGLEDQFNAGIDELSDAQLVAMSPAERTGTFSILGALQQDPRLHGKPHTRGVLIDSTSCVKLGRYPVTVQEFSRFVRFSGYTERRWWQHFGNVLERNWSAPFDWNEQKKVPNAPVVGVSWHEATAYCNWLTEQMSEVGLRARLPSLEEWTGAVETRCDGGFSRPNRDSISESFQRGVPVGIFPEHRGPKGHDDVTGALWEWLGPRRMPSRRRHRLRVTSVLHSDHLHPITKNSRGRMRSLTVGFRVLFTPSH